VTLASSPVMSTIADYSGGIFANGGGTALVLTRNMAASGDGLAAQGSDAILRNSTVRSNTARSGANNNVTGRLPCAPWGAPRAAAP
jgi:hypothetical protein